MNPTIPVRIRAAVKAGGSRSLRRMVRKSTRGTAGEAALCP